MITPTQSPQCTRRAISTGILCMVLFAGLALGSLGGAAAGVCYNRASVALCGPVLGSDVLPAYGDEETPRYIGGIFGTIDAGTLCIVEEGTVDANGGCVSYD